jgi:hypothetical protein
MLNIIIIYEFIKTICNIFFGYSFFKIGCFTENTFRMRDFKKTITKEDITNGFNKFIDNNDIQHRNKTNTMPINMYT